MNDHDTLTMKRALLTDMKTNCKRAYPVQRAPALCGVWGRVSVAIQNYKGMKSNMDSQ